MHRAKCNESNSSSSTPILKMKENLDVNKDVEAATVSENDTSDVDDDQILNLEVRDSSNIDDDQNLTSENDAAQSSSDISDLGEENKQDQTQISNSESTEVSHHAEESSTTGHASNDPSGEVSAVLNERPQCPGRLCQCDNCYAVVKKEYIAFLKQQKQEQKRLEKKQ